MSDHAALYQLAKSDLQAIADPLIDFATQQVSKRGAFLPFGATLANGAVRLHAATTGADRASSTEVLPVLIAGLQRAAADDTAAAVCEWVRITPEGGAETDAVKVWAHHRTGVSVAFYLPATKPFLRSWRFGEMMVQAAPRLVEAWPSVAAV